MRRRPPSIRRARPASFGLLELVMVLAIIAIVGAIAAPRYANALERYRVDAAARLVASDLSLSQALARWTAAPSAVAFDGPARAYTVQNVRDIRTGEAHRTVRLGEAPTVTAPSPPISGGSATVVLDGFGMPSSGGSAIIAGGSVQRTVRVDAAGNILIR